MNSMYSYTGVATMATAMLVVIGVFAVMILIALQLLKRIKPMGILFKLK